jgi:hypothetical protein
MSGSCQARVRRRRAGRRIQTTLHCPALADDEDIGHYYVASFAGCIGCATELYCHLMAHAQACSENYP